MESKATDILTRDKSGDTIRLDDPELCIVPNAGHVDL